MTKGEKSVDCNGNIDRPEDELTVEEIALKKLRGRIKDVILDDEKFNDDYYLLQWLKAQNLRPDNAEKMIRTSLKWRKENRIEELLDQDLPREATEYFTIHFDGVDKSNIPVLSIPVGHWDVRGFVETRGREEYVRFLSQNFIKYERAMIQCNKERNKNRKPGSRITSSSSTGMHVILSATDYNLKQAGSLKAIMAVMECSKIFTRYFPQMAESAYIVNVDGFFQYILKIVKPLLTTIPKIEVFDHNQEIWGPYILDRISEDQLSPEFGGTKVRKNNDETASNLSKDSKMFKS